MEGFEIRLCRNLDYDRIFQLLEQLWPNMKLDYETLYSIFFKALTSDNQKLIVGLSDNKVVGFCSLTIKDSLWVGGSLGNIDELIVDNDFQWQGIGIKLMNEITRLAKENNCKKIELDSASHRKEAHLFYERLGYQNRGFLFSKDI